jgi:hypothetical protein
MRNKKLLQSRLQTLNGLHRKLDMEIHRGGTKESINTTQRKIDELMQDINDIVERE